MWNYNSNVCERKSSMNKLNLFTADKISNDSEIIKQQNLVVCAYYSLMGELFYYSNPTTAMSSMI